VVGREVSPENGVNLPIPIVTVSGAHAMVEVDEGDGAVTAGYLAPRLAPPPAWPRPRQAPPPRLIHP